MPRIEAEAANIHSPTFQQPELHAAQDLELQSDSSKKNSGAKLSAESSSALSNLSEFRALQENNIFKKSGETNITSLALFDSQDKSETNSKEHPKDKTLESTREVAQSKLPSNVTTDAQGRVCKVTYPEEGKTREFGRDANGEINKLTTSTKDGNWSYTKENGAWRLLGDDNKNLAVPSFSISREGEFSRYLDKGEVQLQGLDGRTITEHVNVIGGQIRSNREGQVERVTRPDGSVLTANYEAGELTSISQTKDGTTTKFTRQSSQPKAGEDVIWQSNEAQARSVTNLELSKNGNLSFNTSDGIKHIMRSNGGEIEEGQGKGKYQFDREGRVTSIENADGQKHRTFTYSERDLEPQTATITDKEKGQTFTFQQTQDKSGYALSTAGQRSVWQGKIRIQDDGTYSIRATDSAAEKNIWDSYYADGRRQKESRTADGTLNVFSDKGELLTSKSKSGRELTAEYDEKGLVRAEIKAQNTTTIFSRNTDNSFSSNLQSEVNPVNKLTISETGVSFIRANGDMAKLRTDDSLRVDRTDGSFVESDNSGKVTRVGLDEDNYRSYTYKLKGSENHGDTSNSSVLSQVKETTKAGGEKTWQASNPDGREFSTVSSEGFLTYQKQGKTIVEDINLARIELRQDLQPGKLTMPNGATRTFEYDSKNKLEKITDNKPTPSGEKTQVWRKVSEGIDGTNKFESQTEGGKVTARYDVANDGSGNVHFKSKPPASTENNSETKADSNKERIARAAELLKPSDRSDNIEEAREQLQELANASGIKLDRLTASMDKFEKRAKEAAAEGIKGPSDEQIAKTYDNLSELLKGKLGKDSGKEYFNAKERAQLCEEALHNISAPKRINQGQNPTCNITTGEIFAACRHPEKYADTLKQVAVDGKLITTTGKEVVLDREAYTASPDEKVFDPERDYKGNQRNWASHILENAGINAFTQFAPRGPATWGYRYIGRDSNGNGVNPIMGGPEIQKAVKELWGGDMPYIAHNVAPSAEQLWAYKREGNFPIGIPTLYGYDRNRQLSEQHVQTIHDVREVNGQTQVYLDDQNGGDVGWQTLPQLYSRQGLQGPAETPRGPRIVQRR
ncbi:MAG: hypothetical protein Q8T09_04470 [Candidatus Melainabacteria bacterium]|nr:hypothetical protein [Candidatus Melainabacteria bacterium]